ncbi:MAG: metallophosphoesterase [Deltaproteobacteria bacterium]|nr:MAG: metallophosphoesterase [Deltaproteobacteria bacterium]
MEERFNLQSANWISYVLDRRNQIPAIADPNLVRDALVVFLGNLIDGLYFHEKSNAKIVEKAVRMRTTVRERVRHRYDDIVMDLRDIFSSREWTAVLIPSGFQESHSADRLLTSKTFLSKLSGTIKAEPHLILQLNEAPKKDSAITYVYPPFHSALSKSTRWPGILLWRRSDEPLFFPLPVERTQDAIHWIFSRVDELADAPGDLLTRHYLDAFPSCKIDAASRLTLLHLSDTHIGSKASIERIIRVKDFLKEYMDRNRGDSSTVFLLSGDIMQTPDEGNVTCAKDFHDYLKDLHPSGRDPIFVPGNHDVRAKGVLRSRPASSFLAPAFRARIEWIPDHPVGILCWNSADAGKMARGKITREQYGIIEEHLNSLPGGTARPILISLLHHHPMQLHRIDPEMRRFHMKTLGASFRNIIGFAYGNMDRLTDGQEFVRFCDTHGVQVILHGHKHIPIAGKIPEHLLENRPIRIFGCGSSVGKNTYMYKKLFDVDYEISMNEIVLDFRTRVLSGRLMAETRYDKGLATMKTHHGFLSRSAIDPS